MEENMPKGDSMHPNSLSNLRPNWTKEDAENARVKGLETRRANKELREKLKMSAYEIKKTAEVLSETQLSAVDRLKVLAAQYEDQGDIDSAVDIYKSIVEFEQPKLARIDQTNTDTSAEELSEADLNARIRALMNEDTDEV